MIRAKKRRRWAVLLLFGILVGGGGGIAALALTMSQTTTAATGNNAGLAVGQRAPTLGLPSTSGHVISLSHYRGHKVVVFFYEGAACGPCQEQLVRLQEDLGAITRLGGKIVAASTDPSSVSVSLAKQLHLGFPILLDTRGRLGTAFKIFGLTGGMNMGAVDRHAIFVVNPQGKIAWKELSLNSMHVPMANILTALRRT